VPSNAIAALDGPLFAAPRARAALVDDVVMPNITKVYASYADAWWATKLGLMEVRLSEKKTARSTRDRHAIRT